MAEKKPKKRYGAYKTVQLETTVDGAVTDAFMVLEELGTEMREGADNMSSNNMEHLPNYEVMDNAASELEQFDSAPDVPDCLQGIVVHSSEQVNRRKGRSPSRATRLAIATGMLQDVISTLENMDWAEYCEEHKDDEGGVGNPDDLESEAESLCSELQNAADVSVDFPTMRG